MNIVSKSAVTACLVSSSFLSACTHTIKIEPSDKPILINLNINITQDVRVRLDKSVDDLLSKNEDIF
ncbi:MAG: hypothetical protein COA43_08630 [Robiginitomaculum sp.]|nr:MAG: hypothetical protein COA43_08630 [Robiginitomaculum sp.]